MGSAAPKSLCDAEVDATERGGTCTRGGAERTLLTRDWPLENRCGCAIVIGKAIASVQFFGFWRNDLTISSFGMTSIFGKPGSTELPMFRDFPSDFRYVLGLQEAVVVGMADGYGQATRRAAIANLHSAAGVGNAMGNIFTAYINQRPLIITAGQQARSILPFDPFLYSAQPTELPKPYVKWSIEPARAQDVPLGASVSMPSPSCAG